MEPSAGHDLRHAALRHHMAAVLAGARADIHQVIGAAQRLLIMLHHDQRIAKVAQFVQRAKQFGVVALVQADGGLVQDIQHTHQPEPIWVARRMRCASPPDKVAAARESVR